MAIAQWISFCGDWFNLIAIVTLLGPEKRESAFTIALALILKQLPVVVFTPVAGIFSDRFERRRIMIASDLLRAILVLVLIIVEPTRGSILTIVTLLTIAGAFFEPARTASIPQLVDVQDIRLASGLAATFFPVGLLFGAALGGLVTEYGGVNFALLLDAASFIVSAIFLSKLPPLNPRSADSASANSAPARSITFREFFRTKIPTADHRIAMLIKGLFGLGGAAYLVQLTISAQLNIGETGAVGLGAMLFCRALGALSGGLFGPHLFRDGDEMKGIRIGFFSVALAYFVVALTDRLSLFLPAIFLGHMGSCFIWVFSSIWMHRLFGNEERGRAFGADFSLNMLTSSVSTLVAGYAIQAGMASDQSVAFWCATIWFMIGVLLFRVRPNTASTRSVPVPVPVAA